MRAVRIAVTLGDPSGIGPEVALRALAAGPARRGVRPVLVGDLGVYRDTAVALGCEIEPVEWTPGSPLPGRGIPVVVCSEIRAGVRRLGRPTRAGGIAAYAAIVSAVQLVEAGLADAIVTAPICKANLIAAGTRLSTGHTELLAELTGSSPVRMMMVGPRLRVALVTTHLPVRSVPAALSRGGVLDTIRLVDRSLRGHFGLSRARLGVAGLNPHAGENGLFGDEERRLIAPAVREARRRGVQVEGPLAADSLFPLALRGDFDAVVCMYHDQGLGPFKALHFEEGVNVTLGLPFVRTSPDHGTAHDIAAGYRADASSMNAAIRLAADLARRGRPAPRHARR